MANSQIKPMLMFEGRAEEAMSLYIGLLGGEVLEVSRYGPEGPGAVGSIVKAEFRVRDLDLMCIDSPAKHQFGFTPAVSLFVTCASEMELRRLAEALLEGGAALMPLGNYGFSKLFTWVNDRFGVSWQLNLP